MPIYAYKCGSCGHAKDVLQKISDAPLTVCPECGASAFTKQVTAAGFQLKGSGWYVTDFRNNGSNTGSGSSSSAKTESKSDSGSSDSGAAKSDGAAAKSDSGAAPAAAPAAPAAAPAGSASTPAASS